MSNTLSRRTILQSLGLGAGLVATGTTLAACGGTGTPCEVSRHRSFRYRATPFAFEVSIW